MTTHAQDPYNVALVLTVDGVGVVELKGVAPWRVNEWTRGCYDIIDSAGRAVNPSVTATSKNGTKRNANVVWAMRAIPSAIVFAYNAHLDAEAAAKLPVEAPTPKAKPRKARPKAEVAA